jgi:phosphoglycerate dehydrogenase-like enzyme
MRIAIMDDYQGVALELVDWSSLQERAEIEVFRDHISSPDAVVERLSGFDVVCVMRERTPLPRAILERLPRLKLIASTGPRNASIDTLAASEFNIDIVHTGYDGSPTVELTWALILAGARGIVDEAMSLRAGGWQVGVGDGLHGKTLGLLGLGNVGSAVARIGQAFGMTAIAWSQNLTPEKAEAVGAIYVEKTELFARADVLSIHLVLGNRSRGLVDRRLLGLMKPTARLINTSRGPIVVEADLLAALAEQRIAGACVDVFDIEPLPADHPFRRTPNLLATPHIGYVSKGLYQTFYGDAVIRIKEWMDRRIP